jgi:hypothetical protein
MDFTSATALAAIVALGACLVLTCVAMVFVARLNQPRRRKGI